MATGDLIWADDFQHYETAAGVLSPKWTAIGANMTFASVTRNNRMFDTGDLYDGTLLAAGTGNGYWIKTFSASYAACTIGTWFRTGTLSASIILALADSGTLQLDVRYTTAGLITVTRNGTVLATSTNTLAVNTAYHIELQATIHNTAGTGSYEVKVNGSSVNWIPAANADTANTANNTFNEVRVYSRASNDNSAANHRFAHLYLVEGLSSVGQYVGHTMRPAGVGYVNDYTGNFGSNWLNVADLGNDGDITFNQSATDTDKDAFVLQAAPTGTIHSVQATLNVRQDAGTGHTIRAFLRISGTNYYGAAQTTTAAYQMLTWTWTVNPATTVAWVTADLAAGAIELGYERVS